MLTLAAEPWFAISVPRLQMALAYAAPVVLAGLWFWDVIRPGSLSRMRRKVDHQPVVVWVLTAFCLFCVGAVVAAAAQSLPRSLLGPPESLRASATILLGTYAVVVPAAFALLRLLRPGKGAGADLTIRGADVPLGVLGFVLAYPVVLGGAALAGQALRSLGVEAPEEISHTILKLIAESPQNPWSWGLVAAAVLGAPIAEEIIYRAMLQSGILRATGSPWLAIGVTSAIFAAAHLGSVPPAMMPTLVLIGVALGVAYERTRSLAVPVTMHMVFNGVNIALALATT